MTTRYYQVAEVTTDLLKSKITYIKRNRITRRTKTVTESLIDVLNRDGTNNSFYLYNTLTSPTRKVGLHVLYPDDIKKDYIFKMTDILQSYLSIGGFLYEYFIDSEFEIVPKVAIETISEYDLIARTMKFAK